VANMKASTSKPTKLLKGGKSEGKGGREAFKETQKTKKRSPGSHKRAWGQNLRRLSLGDPGTRMGWRQDKNG